MSAAVKPWHDAPPCPTCEATVATPLALRIYPSFSADAVDRHGLSMLWCPACGATWDEADRAKVAKAWWSAGAHEAHVAISLAGGAT